jgi:hypothetical protein
MLQCAEEEEINRAEDKTNALIAAHDLHTNTRVLIKDLQINKIYGRIDDNDNVVILGVLRSNAQCGYADGMMINPTHRCIFTSLDDGNTVKFVKRWNDYLVELNH